MLEKTAKIQLNNQQIQLLRGVLYEYYNNPSNPNPYFDKTEEFLHNQLETILAKAEDATV